MTPLRIDRMGVRTRLDDLPGWIIETLLDDFEPAALAAQSLNQRNKSKQTKRTGDEPGSLPAAESDDD